MSAIASFLKTVFVPAIIALLFYLLSTYVLLPLFRRHRQRYNQYLPLPLHSTRSLRHRLSDALVSFLIPPWLRKGPRGPDGGDEADEDTGDEWLGDDEAEGLVGLDIDPRRREALERRRSVVGEEERRLSRELEEGFRDESDSE